jgi:seryl-tRNA synthetase
MGDRLQFKLKAKCTFSRELKPARGDMEVTMAGAIPLLSRGAPRGKEAEAARIMKWGIAGKELSVEIESGRYVRAHDALLRLAKLLGEELGKKYKLGIRTIKVSEYIITLPSREISKDALRELKKLPCKIKVEEQAVSLILRNLSEADLRGRVVDRLVSMAEDILARVPAHAVAPKVVRRGKSIKHTFKEDPFEVAKRLGWITEFPGRGQWIYAAPYAKLLRTIEDLIIERVAMPVDFEEAMFPKLIPLEVMQRMPGYLDGVPEGMYYVCPPPREPEAFTGFKQKLKLTKRVAVGELDKALKAPAYVLAPAQCEPFYEIFSRRRIRLEDLPAKLFDRSGWTYRWEGGGVEGFIRTQEFRRIEFVFLGEPSDVVKIRDEVLDKSVELLNELGLEWQLLVATPFYLREGGIGADVSDSSKIATYDLEVALPYKRGWLELGSYNVHRAKFVETFKIKEAKGREIWTGCCGFGTTRWVAGFLAQHGFEPSRWPDLVQERVKPLPQVPRMVE